MQTTKSGWTSWKKTTKQFKAGMAVMYQCCTNHPPQPATYLFGTVDFCQIQLENGKRCNVFKFPGWRKKVWLA